jgi:hypothetical protein
MGFLIAFLMAGDPAPAGEAYARGCRLFEEKKFDEAAAAFEEALRHEPAESASLRYRNAQGRNRHPYYPRFLLAEARMAQARSEAGLYVKREKLQAAARHYGLSAHEEGRARAAEAVRALEELEKAIAEAEASAVPPEIAQLRTKVDRLCEASSFEDAFREIGAAAVLLRPYEKIQAEILASVRSRQRAAIRNYEGILASRLDSISRTDPTYEAEIVLPLLKPARIPPEIVKDPDPRFRWLLEFCAAYEKDLELVRGAATLDLERLVPSAAGFDALASKALEADLFNGFRASRNMAHAMRTARLKELAAAAEKPDTNLPGMSAFRDATARLLEVSDASRAKAEEDLGARLAAGVGPTEELRKYVEGDLPYHKRQVDALRGKIREVTVAYERRVAAEASAKAAEEGLVDPARMADPEACRKILRDLSLLESQAYFETLPAPVRARVLFARAVGEAVTAFLEAEPPARVAERCKGDVLRAYGLDAEAHKAWRDAGRLSPRLAALFEGIRKP